MHDRLHALIDQTKDDGTSGSPDIVPESPPAYPKIVGTRPGETSSYEADDKPQHICELEKRGHSDESAKCAAASTGNMELPAIPTGNMALPPIPTFREFLSQKGRDRAKSYSSCNAANKPSGICRKSSGQVDKEETSKRMKS